MTAAIGLSPDKLLGGLGAAAIYAVVWAIVFTESGLLIGFFLPGDTLLLLAGVLAKNGRVNVAVLAAGVAVAAVVGDSVGYTLGRRAGRPLLLKRDGIVLNKHNLDRATAFYDRFGSATVLLARFVPWARTFAPVIAGATLMPYRRFVLWNVGGGLLWGVGITLLGYGVGEIPGFDKYAVLAVGVMVVVSFVPAIWHYRAAKRRRRDASLVAEQAELVDGSVD